jgi:4-hydroxybenzoate polyprenyltransferase
MGARAPVGVALFYGAAILLAFLPGRLVLLGPAFLVGWLLFAAHLGWQAWRFRTDDPRGALRLFRSNRDAGLLLFAALALGWIGT